jgi:hypothetical protein
MKIINAKTFFTLVSVKGFTQSAKIELILSRNPFLPRKFNKRDFKSYVLQIHLLSQNSKFLDLLKSQVGELIEISDEDGMLVFSNDWSFIAEIEFEKYEEFVNEFGIEDWAKDYESLIEFYYKEYDSNVRDSMSTKKFIDKLKFFLEKEIENTELKNSFLIETRNEISVDSNKIDLAIKILNLIKTYETREE